MKDLVGEKAEKFIEKSLINLKDAMSVLRERQEKEASQVNKLYIDVIMCQLEMAQHIIEMWGEQKSEMP